MYKPVRPPLPGRLALAAMLAVAAADASDPPNRTESPTRGALFEELPVVEAASLHTQTLQEAPANVTVITDDDIRRYGYRTLGEALASARGFYMMYDRAYHYVGLRGYLLPGDLNTRFLVMINGHYMTENIYNSNEFFGQDFGLDMDLVKRIEIIRGPSSALYGSNGVFCTVNIVTKSPVEHPLAQFSTEFGSFGERKAQASSSLNLGHGANLLLSVSVFNNGGQDLYYPEFDAPETNYGWARGVDGERGYHTFANLVWRNWSFIAYANTREKHAPTTPWFETLFAARATKMQDGHNFFEAAYTKNVRANGRLQLRFYYDRYQYHGYYERHAEDAVAGERDIGQGDWAGSQVAYRWQWSRRGALTAGAEFIGEARALQQADIVVPARENLLRIDKPDRRHGVFAQQEIDLSRRWKAQLGLRYDASHWFQDYLSPRAALLFQQSPATVYKFLYGRAFRNPSSYEAFYDDGGLSQFANPRLRAEIADSFEVSIERTLGREINAIATTYYSKLRGLIQAVPVDGIVYQYQNTERNRVYGLELELNGKVRNRVQGAASFALQQAENLETRSTLPNSPAAMGKVRLAVPLWNGKISLSNAWQYVGARETLNGRRLPGVFLGEFNIATLRITPHYDAQFGIRNLLDRAYWDPAGSSLIIERIRADGRSVFLKLIWRTRE